MTPVASSLFETRSHPSAREFEQDLLRRGARPKSCYYVSTPITTGPLTLSKKVAAADLIKMNVRHARQVVARTEERVGAVVIDPTQFEDVEGWEQPDYHAFWLEIIGVYVGAMVFCDGWEFSTGCSIEFASAVQLGLPREDEMLLSLADQRALDLLVIAIEQLEAAKLSSMAQRAACELLTERLDAS